MKIGNITLIIGGTYYTNFGENIVKLKLDKILHERISEDKVQVRVSSFPRNRNDKNPDSWILWSNEVFYTRNDAKKEKTNAN